MYPVEKIEALQAHQSKVIIGPRGIPNGPSYPNAMHELSTPTGKLMNNQLMPYKRDGLLGLTCLSTPRASVSEKAQHKKKRLNLVIECAAVSGAIKSS